MFRGNSPVCTPLRYRSARRVARRSYCFTFLRVASSRSVVVRSLGRGRRRVVASSASSLFPSAKIMHGEALFQTFLHFLMFDFGHELFILSHRPRKSLTFSALRAGEFFYFRASARGRLVGSSSIRGRAYLYNARRTAQEDGTGGRHRRTAQEAKTGALWRLSPRRWGDSTDGTKKRPKIDDFGAFRAISGACLYERDNWRAYLKIYAILLERIAEA